MKLLRTMSLSAVLLSLLFFMQPSISYGQTPKTAPTPKTSPTPVSKPIDDTLKIIKEKIEDKVDEINKSSKKVVSGILSKIDDDILELQQSDGRMYKVSVDETVTKFFTATTKKITAAEKSDLEKGDLLVVLGPIIEDQISANKIIQQSNYVTAQGEITNVDSDNFTVDIVTSDKDEISLDVEQGTTQQIMDTKTLELTKAGFSKYKIGDKIHAVYVKPAKEGDKATTIRTLIIPQEFFAESASPTKSVSPTPEN